MRSGTNACSPALTAAPDTNHSFTYPHFSRMQPVKAASRLKPFLEEITLISAATFLEQLADRRRQAQAEALQSLSIPQDVVLPQELRIAVNFGGLVSPVLARSVFAPLGAYKGIPSCDPAQLLHWFATYPDCNWALSTGVEAGIIAAEFDYGLTQQSLVDVTLSVRSWRCQKLARGIARPSG